MKTLHKSLIFWSLPLLTVGFIVSSLSAFSHATPVELGKVAWNRSLKEAIPIAKENDKPIFILFQEVPGCFTCQNYGHKVLSHPLVVEAIESLFVPVVVFNNRGGEDAQTLKKFGEPSWNNPVVRIVDINEKNIVPRLSGNYTMNGLVNNMIKALNTIDQPIPNYLLLLQQELSAHQGQSEHAVFSMYCFWSGEAAFGSVDGVIATRPGFLEGREVVEVEFDPNIISYTELIKTAKAKGMASRVFTRNPQQQKHAQKIVGNAAVLSTKIVRPDNEPKYYLAHTPLKYIPMTSLQAARVNTAVGYRQDIHQFLSPRQLYLLKVIQQNPNAGWKNQIEQQDLTMAWEKALKKVEGLMI